MASGFLLANGAINSGGNCYSYLAGTTTPANTFTDYTGTVLNPNPITLLSDGTLPNEIWVPQGQITKFVVTDSSNNSLKTYDEIPGVNDVSINTSANLTFTQPLSVNSTGVVSFGYTQTAAEQAAGVTPNNTTYFAQPWLWVRSRRLRSRWCDRRL